jgi:hypothetical protein
VRFALKDNDNYSVIRRGFLTPFNIIVLFFEVVFCFHRDLGWQHSFISYIYLFIFFKAVGISILVFCSFFTCISIVFNYRYSLCIVYRYDFLFHIDIRYINFISEIIFSYLIHYYIFFFFFVLKKISFQLFFQLAGFFCFYFFTLYINFYRYINLLMNSISQDIFSCSFLL